MQISSPPPPALYRLLVAELEAGDISVNRVAAIEVPFLEYHDNGYESGPTVKSLKGVSARKAVKEVMTSLSPVFSFTEQQQQLQEAPMHSLPPPIPMVVLTGPQGAGKSVIAAAIAREMREEKTYLARTVSKKKKRSCSIFPEITIFRTFDTERRWISPHRKSCLCSWFLWGYHTDLGAVCVSPG